MEWLTVYFNRSTKDRCKNSRKEVIYDGARFELSYLFDTTFMLNTESIWEIIPENKGSLSTIS